MHGEVWPRTQPERALRGRRGQFSRYQKGCGIVIGHLLGKNFEFAVPERQLKLAPVEAV